MMAGFDPDQPRDDWGRWVEAGRAARKAAGLPSKFSVRSFSDLQKMADSSLPSDDSEYEYFYHAFRWQEDLERAEKEGLNNKVYLSKDEIRDRGAGFAIVRVPCGLAQEGRDVVEDGLVYREWVAPKAEIVRVFRQVNLIGGGGHGIREDRLAQYALLHQNPSANLSNLPKKYREWFFLQAQPERS